MEVTWRNNVPNKLWKFRVPCWMKLSLTQPKESTYDDPTVTCKSWRWKTAHSKWRNVWRNQNALVTKKRNRVEKTRELYIRPQPYKQINQNWYWILKLHELATDGTMHLRLLSSLFLRVLPWLPSSDWELPITALQFVYRRRTHCELIHTNHLPLFLFPCCGKFPPCHDIKFVFLRWFQGPSVVRDLRTWFCLRLTIESPARG
jgi:hypothetical protein